VLIERIDRNGHLDPFAAAGLPQGLTAATKLSVKLDIGAVG